MKKFELRFVLVFVLLVISATFAGYMMQDRLKSVIDKSRSNAHPDVTSQILHDLSEATENAELTVKSFRLTKDTLYRLKFNGIKDSIASYTEKLKKQAKDRDIISEAEKIEFLIGQRFEVFDSLLFLDDYFRVQTALGKVQDDINKISNTKLQDTVKNDTIKDGFFARVFRSKKKREAIEAKRNESLVNWTEEIDRQVQRIRNEEKRIENALKAKEIELLKSDSALASQQADVLLAIENTKQANIKKNADFAEKQVEEVNTIIIVFAVLATGLLLFMATMIYLYVRRNSRYKKMLKQTSNEAFRLANVRKQFLANMSHEIRTPLNSINGFTELLVQSDLDEKQKEHVSIIQSSNKHLMTVVNDVLDYSKLDEGKLKLTKLPFDVHVLAKTLRGMFSKQAEDKGVNWDVEVDTDHKQWLGDEYRIKQILINLIGNAIKFTDEGAVRCKISEIDIGLRFVVQDEGTGMEEEELKHVFNAFEQAASNTTASQHGTGLGLAITKKIVDSFGGEINMTSELNKGTTVTIDLPLMSTEIKSSDEVKAHQVSIEKPHRVLVVDDEVFNQKLMAAVLDKFEINHDIASNGKEALEKIQIEQYDCLLLDVRMPEVDGFEFLRQYKKRDENMRIFALSAALSDEDHEELIQLGVEDILYKPFNEGDILTVFSKSYAVHRKKRKNMKYNLGPLKEASGGDQEFVVDMLNTLLNNIDDTIQYTEVFIKEKDWIGVADQAHKLAGSLRHIDAQKAYPVLKKLEQEARNKQNEELLRATYDELKKALKELYSDLEKEIEKLK